MVFQYDIKTKMKTIKIKELNIEVETELHTEMDSRSKIKIPKGWRLMTLSEWIFIYNNYQDKMNYGDYPDEIVEQPIEKDKEKYPYWNVWFRYLDGNSGLGGYRFLYCYDRVRGVRFCRDLKQRGKTK